MSRNTILLGEEKSLNDQVALNTTSIPSSPGQKPERSESESAKHRELLQKKVDLLKRGLDFMKSVHSYTGSMDKQEVVHGELLELQSIELKCRHKPFSVYLNWTAGDVGREVIFVEGKNDDRMIAHDGGWKARIPAFNLDPECSLAMRDARYPVTKFGVACLIETMLEIHEKDLQGDNIKSCQMETDQKVDDRTCYKFTTTYKSKNDSPVYRKSITYIDSQWSIPVYTEHFEWDRDSPNAKRENLDETTLIEKYAFRGLSFNEELTEDHFDRSNKEYKFR